MKSISSILILVLLQSCSPNFNKDFSVYRKDNNYKMWITYYGTKKDTIAINWLLSYQIENNTSRGVKFDWIRKRPEYLIQTEYMLSNDSLIIFEELINKRKNRDFFLFCSKLVSVKDFPKNYLENKNVMFTLGQSKKNISIVPSEQKHFKKSSYFQNILKEIENDSIAIVFRDTVSDDYFEYNGVIKDKVLKYSKWK